jgi:hypothetical protein
MLSMAFEALNDRGSCGRRRGRRRAIVKALVVAMAIILRMLLRIPNPSVSVGPGARSRHPMEGVETSGKDRK